MSRQLWLAGVLRAAGLTVVEHAGWKTHDRPGDWNPTYGVVHATAAPRSQADSVQVAVVRDGRSDLPGPIANACVDRAGRWHVLSAGRCNSTLAGTAGPYEGLGNTNALSTEACNDNISEPWPAAQYESYVRGWAAWCRRLGWPASRLVGHKEHTPGRKTDPTFDMARFRADVAAVLAGEDDDMDFRDGGDGEALIYRIGALINGAAVVAGGPTKGERNVLHEKLNSIIQTQQTLAAAEASRDAALRSVVEQLAAAVAAGGGSVDTAAILAGVDAAVASARADLRDAVADLGEGGAAQVRGPQG